MAPMARSTVLSLRVQANQTRGSQLTAFVILYPFGVVGSVPKARPLFKSPRIEPSGFFTNVPTKFKLVKSTLEVRGSKARESAVANAAAVSGLAHAGRYSSGAFAGS